MGYRTYLDLIHDLTGNRKVLSSGMRREVERCTRAVDLAREGRKVAVVCSGDPGIYAMAGLVLEILKESCGPGAGGLTPGIEIVPGVPALSACAALLGAPLMHDFASISLSDLLTPWEIIEKRIEAAASADFVIVIYNPKSRARQRQINRARDIVLRFRPPQTPAGIVRAASRENERIIITSLRDMPFDEIDMQSTVIIGNSRTFAWNGRMVTPRGYGDKYRLALHKPEGKNVP